MNIQSLLKSRLITTLPVIIFAAVSFITVELYWQKREVDNEIKRLQDQHNALNSDNQQLSDLIKYLETDEFKEKEAREKLNLKKPGEEVVVLPEESDSLGNITSASTDSRSNPKKWFDYFFNK